MPNWCFNELKITGSDVEKFKTDAKSDDSALSFEKLYPIELDVEKRTHYWGTKWDVEAEIMGEDKDYVCYTFESAWSPPLSALIYIAKNYPGLEFSLFYAESGNDFMGYLKACGESHQSKEASYYERHNVAVVLQNVDITGAKMVWSARSSGYLEPDNLDNGARGDIQEITIEADAHELQYNTHLTLQELFDKGLVSLSIDPNDDYIEFECLEKMFSEIDLETLVASVVEKQKIEKNVDSLVVGKALKI